MLQDFIRISQYAGNRFDLTPANGGNSSVKIDDYIFIKSSGYYLSDVNEKTAFTKVKLPPLCAAFQNIEKFTNKQIIDLVKSNVENGNYPSIEIGMHVLLGKLILHTHPLTVNAIVCRQDWQQILSQLFPEAVLVPYATPGVSLARAVWASFKNSKKNNNDTIILFLQNHGLVVSSDNAETIISETQRVTEKLEKELKLDLHKYKVAANISDFISKIAHSHNVCHCCEDQELYNLLQNNNALWFEDYSIPEAYIYNTIALEIKNLGDEALVAAYIKKYRKAPQVIIYQNHIYLLAKNIKQALELESPLKEQLLICKLTGSKIRPLTTREIKSIDEELLS